MTQWAITPPDDCWHWIEPLLAKSLKRYGDQYETSDFLGYLQNGACQLWVLGNRSAVICDVTEYPKKRLARIIVGMGKLDDTRSFLPVFEAWAKQAGCSGVSALVRPGFVGFYDEFSWKKTNILMEKDF